MTAAWSAVLSFLTVGAILVFAWVLGAGSGTVTDIIGVSGTMWLACHLIPVTIPDGTISALPLGLVVIPGWHLWRAGRWATRRSGACHWSEIGQMVFVGVSVYATIALLVSSITASDEASVSALWAVLGTATIALLFFGAGTVKEAGLFPSLTARVSPTFRRRLRGAIAGIATVACAAALLVATSLAIHFSTSLTLLGVLSPGLIGNILLFILGLAYLPNVLIWAMAFVLGSGFAVGESTVVSPFGFEVAGVPSFPLFAAIPDGYSSYYLAVLVVPLVAGAVVNRVASPRTALRIRSAAALRERVWLAGLPAVAMFGLAWLAMGSLGINLMAVVGSNPLYVAFNTFVLFFVGGVLGDCIRRCGEYRRDRSTVDVTDRSTRRRRRRPTANT